MSRGTILLAEDHNLSVRIMRVMNYILKFSDKTSVDLASVIGLLDYWVTYILPSILIYSTLQDGDLEILILFRYSLFDFFSKW